MATTLISTADLAVLPDVPEAALAGLPARVTRAAENYCGRPLALASRDEEYTPGTTRIIRLKGRPVQSVDRIQLDLSSALIVQYHGPAWRASVSLQVSGPADLASGQSVTGLTLWTEAGPTLVAFAPLTGPTLATVADLAAAVTAIGGWSATVSANFAACPLLQLRPSRAGLEAKAGPALIQAYASAAGRYELNARTGRITLFDIRPDPFSYPNRACGAIGNAGLARVLYTAGYNGDPAQGPVTTPPDLVEGCILTAKAILDAREVSGAYASVKLGNTSFDAGTPDTVPVGARRFFSPYVDRRP